MKFYLKNMQKKASNWMPWTKAEAEPELAQKQMMWFRQPGECIQAICGNSHTNV